MLNNKTLQIRVSDYTLERLEELSKSTGWSKSEVIRRSLDCMNEKNMDALFGVDVLKTVLPFDGHFKVVSFGLAGNSYLDGKGFKIKFECDFDIGLTHNFQCGPTHVSFDGRNVCLTGGFLNDIQNALNILYSSRN